MTRRNRALLRDARNRSLRTFLQGLGVSLLLALCLLVPTLVQGEGWGDVQWAALSFVAVQTVLTTAASFVMRWFLDSSAVPTPLPPAESGQPAER